MKVKSLTRLALAGLLSASMAAHAETREYKDVPEGIFTPDKLETSIGTMKFEYGVPTKETVKKAYDELDKQRATQAFLQGIQIASMEAVRKDAHNMGQKEAHQIMIFDQLMDNKPLYLTGNTETVYAFNVVDLKKDKAVVYEIPAGTGPILIDDANYEWVTDLGPVGPDKGKGGTYLLLSPDYKDGDIEDLKGKEIPSEGATPVEMKIANTTKTVFVVQSRSYTNWIALRGFLKDGKPDYSSKLFRKGVKIYPLAKASNPPTMEFINCSEDDRVNTIHSNDYHFFVELNEAIQREHIGFIPEEMRGLFASIGIIKGKEFAPDARMKKILEDGANIGNTIARSILYSYRNKDAYFWEGTQWYTTFPGLHYKWYMDANPNAGRYLDSRALFHFMAIANTPAMSMEFVGKGSQYVWTGKDSDGNTLKGENTYKLRVPANVPAKDFWSMVVYDGQTRSMYQAPDQKFPSINNKRGGLKVNNDGTVDIFIGPKAPKGYENNWIQTVPGKAWASLFRLYGPLEPWFDRTWKLNNIELVK
jgi:hypothetical protein